MPRSCASINDNVRLCYLKYPKRMRVTFKILVSILITMKKPNLLPQDQQFQDTAMRRQQDLRQGIKNVRSVFRCPKHGKIR